MAEIVTTEKTAGKSPSKKKNIRIDMTPMVDLGFLLITFFMFAASFSKPNVMDLGLPAKGIVDTPVDIGVLNQVTFLLGKDNTIYYYPKETKDLTPGDLKKISLEGLEVAKKIQELKKAAPRPEIFTVIIKPTDDSTYKNFVDIMDEMALSKHEIYGVSEVKPTEKDIYRKLTP